MSIGQPARILSLLCLFCSKPKPVMSMNNKNLFGSLMISAAATGALFLAGCGEDYQMTLYRGFPYGNERTAGSGVTYVRANLMPEKGPVLSEIELPQEPEAPEPEAVEPEPVKEFPKEAEEMFRAMQKK